MNLKKEKKGVQKSVHDGKKGGKMLLYYNFNPIK